MMNQLTFGIDQVLNDHHYLDKKIALVCTRASVTVTGVASRVALLAKGFKLVKLFSPEHGLDAAGADGLRQRDHLDAVTGLPVISLYGDTIAPSRAQLEGVDLVIIDLPDVGCRFYTYLWTMTHVMEACAAFSIPVLIADRPNPLGGDLALVEGPMLDEVSCSSFIGRWRIPIRHSCTLGELARYFSALRMPELQLSVAKVMNWSRTKTNSFLFEPTSPAISDYGTALLYPGMGLLEGININEGRGTPMPFKQMGAPWIGHYALAEEVRKNSPGLDVIPVDYVPLDGLYKEETCYGLRLEVVNEQIFRPVKTGINLIKAIIKLHPTETKERLYDTHVNPGGKAHLDKLTGIPGVFTILKNQEVINTDQANEWEAIIKNYLLYR